MSKTINMPLVTRSANLRNDTIDEEKRTVEVMWSNGARVDRYNYMTDEKYEEELSLDPKDVDLSRLNNGAAFLNSHNAWELDAVIGVVEKAWIHKENGTFEGRAIIRFSENEEVNSIWNNVKNGIIRAVSVGYSVKKYEITREDGKMPVYRAVDWQPHEISAVAVGADADAGFRSKEQQYQCLLQEKRMDDDKKAADAVVEQAVTPVKEVEQRAVVEPTKVDIINKDDVIKEERTRTAGIYDTQEKLGVKRSDADILVKDGISLDEARAKLIDFAARNDKASKVTTGVIMGRQDEVETRRSAIANALLHRSDSSVELLDSAREWRGLSLIEMIREESKIRGDKTRGLSRMDTARRAFNSTSDFPNIFADVASKTLRKAYQNAGRTFQPFCRKVSVNDFKNINAIQLGEAPQLEKVNESGEFERGSMAESKETYKVETYGKVLPLTRQSIINDDLNAFTRVPQSFGVAGANKESDIVWAIITANDAMADGVALFHATHANLASGSGGAPSITTISAGRKAMRVQTGLDGETLLNILPEFIIIPAALEGVVDQFLSSNILAATSANIVAENIRTLQKIVEPRLDSNSAKAWYLAGSPNQIDTVECATLEGKDGVYIETRQGFNVDGIEIKARMDFGAKAIDHRGLYKNAGGS